MSETASAPTRPTATLLTSVLASAAESRRGRHRKAARRPLARWALSLGAGLGLAVTGQGSAHAAPATSLSSAALTSSMASRQVSLPVEKPLLRYGMSGPHVVLVQRELGVTPRSGYFGPRTERAVQAFQARHGLEPDGQVGPLTWAALGYGETPAASGVVSPMRAGTYRLSGYYNASGGPWSGRRHKGLDFAAPRGTRVQSVAKGIIVDAGWAGGCGYRVVVQHPSGTHTWYCHLSRITRWSGAVKAGYKLGEVGATGHATGNHLHFEVRLNGTTRVNPLPWLANRGVSL